MSEYKKKSVPGRRASGAKEEQARENVGFDAGVFWVGEKQAEPLTRTRPKFSASREEIQ
jgi:hypothetical protein